MKNPFELVQPIAPRLHRRRLAKRLIPLAGGTLAAVIAVESLSPGRPAAWSALWLGAVLALLGARLAVSSPVLPLRALLAWKRWRKGRGLRSAAHDLHNVCAVARLRRKLGWNGHRFAWIFDLGQLLAMAAFAAWLGALPDPAASPRDPLLVLFLLLASVAPLMLLLHEAMGHVRWGQLTGLWFALAGANALAYSLAFKDASNDPLAAAGVFVLALVLGLFVHTIQRLSIGASVISKVIQGLSEGILEFPNIAHLYRDLPGEIRRRLPFDRVFLLDSDSGRRCLKVVGQAGEYPDVVGKDLKWDQGITGRVVREGRAEAWNDVHRCNYYAKLVPDEKDDTRAEVAVPISHQGITYGVLDVQSRYPGVYGQAEVETLAIIAKILGAAHSAHKADLILEEALAFDRELWSLPVNSDYALFREFGHFALNHLGAHLVIYYPLSITGFPVQLPFTAGELRQRERIKGQVSDPQSPLVQLIRRWEIHYDAEIDETSLFSHPDTAEPPSFVEREEIRSACFLPIGTVNDRLGALLLNFRDPRHFDSLFLFTLLNFAKAFSTVAARLRYQEFFYESFGRPELGVHNLIHRYGLEKSSLQEFRKSVAAHLRLGVADRAGLKGQIEAMLAGIEGFVEEVNLVEATLPPDIWAQTLVQVLKAFVAALPVRPDGRKPEVSLERIDERIERESAWFKLALYRVVTEAINNAVFHGEASSIRVSIRRAEYRTEVEVLNNGLPLPEDSRERKSRRGVYAMMEEFERRLGATTAIVRGEGGLGARMSLSIPCLPL